MKKQNFQAEIDGFAGTYYGGPHSSRKAVILMLDDSSTDRMAKGGAKWVIRNDCHALCVSAEQRKHGLVNYPIECIGKAIDFLKSRDMEKIGIAGASSTAVMALVAASYYPEIILTIAMTPSDFVMEGVYPEGKAGLKERPGENESIVSWQGSPLPYLPYAYRYPEYWQKIREESKTSGNKISTRFLFDESENRHPVQEDERIKVERIHGKIVFIGSEDDVMWDTCRYIRRMEERLSSMPHNCTWEDLLYEHGTHFVFPETMLKSMLPVGSELLVKFMFKAAREHPKECQETWIDIDRKLKKTIREW